MGERHADSENADWVRSGGEPELPTDLLCEHEAKTSRISASKKKKKKAGVQANPAPVPCGVDA
eukprot:6403215-Karenia_brevis.AAC.1